MNVFRCLVLTDPSDSLVFAGSCQRVSMANTLLLFHRNLNGNQQWGMSVLRNGWNDGRSEPPRRLRKRLGAAAYANMAANVFESIR
jgi:hypothetical protein